MQAGRPLMNLLFFTDGFSRSFRLGVFLLGFLQALKLERQMSVDERCAAVGLNQLAGNPRSFWRANESDGIADIRGSAEAAHGRPAAFLPFAYPVWKASGKLLSTLSSTQPGLMEFTVMPRPARATAK